MTIKQVRMIYPKVDNAAKQFKKVSWKTVQSAGMPPSLNPVS
jgi:hypothetical protein